jgi:hypothetical protein
MERMVVGSSLLGVLIGWILITSLGTAAGFSFVVAWRRWGDRVSLPPKVQTTTEKLLGPQKDELPVKPEAAVDAEIEHAGTEADLEPEQEAEVEPDDEAGQEEATGPEAPQEEAEQEEPGSEDLPLEPQPEIPVAAAPSPPALEQDPTTVRLPRADAIEEISLLFDAPYEAANALLESGLWGLQNHDEYARAMRGKNPPTGVPPALFQAVVNASPKDYQGALERIRKKRDAMKQLTTLWGVGPEQAEALYQAGFQDLDKIRSTSTDKLAKTPGIGHALAFQIRAAAHGLAPAPGAEAST